MEIEDLMSEEIRKNIDDEIFKEIKKYAEFLSFLDTLIFYDNDKYINSKDIITNAKRRYSFKNITRNIS
ncbi:MAG: hypothetical protein K9L74_05670 [Candidatus Izimaplasma sp.]|nr:hypothetical protein [Candidatus Izimaplasma bacterium]